MPSSFPLGAIAGLRVIDLTRVLGGPYCTQILGDHGAEIIKIEPPAGDETRDWAPVLAETGSAYFNGANRNKRSLGLDLTKPRGRDVLMRLLAERRRADRELQARHARQMGHRQRVLAREISAPDPLPHLRLRRRRAARRPAGL